MNTLQPTEIQTSPSSIPMEATAKYHSELTEKYQNTDPEHVVFKTGEKALINFNGYYAINTTTVKGAFFAVDTNMHMKKGATKPIYDVSFLICLDGITCKRYAFTGYFNGNVLTQTSNDNTSVDLNLTFTREDNSKGTTASLSGNIALPGASPVQVSGVTYNNPIKYEIYEGTYYNVIGTNKKENKPGTKVEALQIKNGYEILFDYDSNDGTLVKVPSYTYNLNMYFFSFSKKDAEEKKKYHLIMGTGAAKGLVAGNMIITTPKEGKKTVANRQLLTIPFPNSDKPGFPNLSSNELAKFSAYYTLPSVAPNAFFSIQAEYNNIDSFDIYGVIISYSADGTTSNGFYFDENNMSFNNNVLTAKASANGVDYSFHITFNRTYDATNRSLVTISGNIITTKSANGSLIANQTINGYTPFNPVPLTAFGGAILTGTTTLENGKTENLSLEIINDNEIIYNGITMKSFIYVPLMYILAYPIENTTLVMSFGPDSVKGNSCIITDYSVTPPKTLFVCAINN
ncbi:hypothetical protein [Tenacibaculum sp. M341]|uniref:hypothetical protein n=1 Tax=Tenacibaculum sp. M341 TaxID=2530339 RepID=UPI0010532C51|nr:hypothetical protein [Tenacibaculum sp. M341]TCI91317.1 hypothetical protein EYW44_10195 [Tenacibaculum sp. M341]